MANITLFAQTIAQLPRQAIRKIIRATGTDKHSKAKAMTRGKFRFRMPLRLLDSTLISLTLPVYDWAHYTTTKGAVKMHTLLDYDCLLPEFVNITDGKGSDNKAAYSIPVNPYSIVDADRGYCDYGLLNHWDSSNVFFVVRHKDNIRYKTIRERPLPEKWVRRLEKAYGLAVYGQAFL